MSSIDSTSRSSFFPGARTDIKTKGPSNLNKMGFKRNDSERKEQIDDLTKEDVKVSIPDAVRDFSRIKKAVDAAPEIDNSRKIEDLKNRIQSGSYQMDYEGIADKLLSSEF